MTRSMRSEVIQSVRGGSSAMSRLLTHRGFRRGPRSPGQAELFARSDAPWPGARNVRMATGGWYATVSTIGGWQHCVRFGRELPTVHGSPLVQARS